MKRTLVLGLAALGTFAAAGPAAADPVSKADRVNAARACTALRTTLGAQTFAQTYGASTAARAYGQCVVAMRREAHAARHAARTTCARATKAKGKGRAKAQAACVARTARAELKQEIDATKNAAHACKAERADMGEQAFRDEYGTNVNKRNAFGKCVSAKAKEQNGGAGGDSDAAKQLRATLTGTVGSGAFTATVNLGRQQLCYTLTATGLTDITAAHIHVKPSGDIVVPLAAPTTGSSSGCVAVARTLLQQILATPANYYVNVHTTAAPAGAISGDLTR
jgi:hypothetical protein